MNLTKLTLLLLLVAASALATLAQDAARQALNDQFWEAARKGDVAQVKALLDKGADVNAKFRYGTTALFKAAERGHIEVVKLLLERGADVNIRDTFYGATAMTWALTGKHIEVVRALLQKSPKEIDDVLLTGTREGNPDLVRVAVEVGSAKPETLTASLILATNEAKTEIAEILKKAGAQPPLAIDSATLNSYTGTYKPEQGAEVTISLKDSTLHFLRTGQQQSLALMPIDKTTFRPAAFEGATITFVVEAEKVTGAVFKQGTNTVNYKKQ